MSKNELTLDDFLDNAKNDIVNITNYFLEFFIDRDFVELIKDFRTGLKDFSNSIVDLKTRIHSYKKNHLKQFIEHGLYGDELQRKLVLFQTSREIFSQAKLEFVSSFKNYITKVNEHLDESVEFEKLEKFSPVLKKIYEKTRNALKTFKRVTRRHFGIINIYLKSLVSVVNLGGLASEFKDTVEAVMKSDFEKTPSLSKTIKQFGSKTLLTQVQKAL